MRLIKLLLTNSYNRLSMLGFLPNCAPGKHISASAFGERWGVEEAPYRFKEGKFAMRHIHRVFSFDHLRRNARTLLCSSASVLAMLATFSAAPAAGQDICTFTSDQDEGANTFRACIEQANTGPTDTVVSGLAADSTVQLQTPVAVSGDLIIGAGGPAVILSNSSLQERESLLRLTSADTLTITDAVTLRTVNESAAAIDMTGIGSTLDFSGRIETTGDFGSGVLYGVVDEYAYEDVNGATAHIRGTVTTSGRGAMGAGAHSNDNSLFLHGTITTTGPSATAISTEGDRNLFHLLLGSVIDVSGKGSNGIFANTGESTILVEGTITTRGEAEGNSSGQGANGIFVFNYGDMGNEIRLRGQGAIITETENAVGIYTVGGNNSIYLENGIRIETRGALSASAISVRGTGNRVEMAGATITTHGGNSSGIVTGSDNQVLVGQDSVILTHGQSSYAIHAGGSGGTVTLASGSLIETRDDYAYGINANLNAVVLEAGSRIETAGRRAYGIDFTTNLTGGRGNAVIAGAVATSGEYAAGIQASAGRSDITIKTGGSVVTTGTSAPGQIIPHALSLNGGGNIITLEAGSLVSSAAANAHGIWMGGFTGNNYVYAGGTISATGAGANAIRFTAGANLLELRPGYGITGDVVGTGSDILAFGGSGNASFDLSRLGSQYTGFNTLRKTGDSVWTLTGNGSGLTTPLTVSGGGLNVTGSLGSALSIQNGAKLGGTGTLGAVTVANGGTLSPGNSPGTLTMDSLMLNNGSILDFELGAPGVAAASDRIDVTGNLTLDGILNVTDAGGFGNGVYTLINYGTLVANNGLDLGATPTGYNYNLNAGTGAASAVTLEVTGGTGGTSGGNQYWDGANMAAGNTLYGRGGAGVWNAANTNWTNTAGSVNAGWANQFAVFYNGTGDVTVEGEQSTTGLQFASDGYRLVAGAGGSLRLRDDSWVRVDAGQTATLELPIAARSFRKVGAGTLNLTGEVDIVSELGGYGGGYYGGDLDVGQGTLRIIGAGQVAADYVYVMSGARLEVDGVGTVLTARRPGNYSLNVGHDGYGELAITGGAVVNSGHSEIGSTVLSIEVPNEGRATVSGAGSFWNAKNLVAGIKGGDGELLVTGGGVITGEGGYVGSGNITGPTGRRSSTGRATLTGAGSAWTVTKEFGVGVISGHGRLTLNDGGRVDITAESATQIGHGAGSDGRVLISGTGSEMRVRTGGLHLGSNEGTGDITVSEGGLLRVDSYYKLTDIPGGGPLGGDITQITRHDGLIVGHNDGTATLNVTNGGTVEAGLLVVSEYSDSGIAPARGTVVLDGAGSSITIAENLQLIGGGTFTVSGGAQLRSFDDSVFATNPNRYVIAPDQLGNLGTHDAIMTVTGEGSAWHSGNTIRADYRAALNINDGALVSVTDNMRIGFGRARDIDGPAASLSVDGATLRTGGILDIANGGAWAEVAFTNGATIETHGVMAGSGGTCVPGDDGTCASGNTYVAQADILVSGSGTTWTDTGAFGFGLGSSGVTTLTLTDQAVIETETAAIGWSTYGEARADVIVSDRARFSTVSALRLAEGAERIGTLTVTDAGSLVAVGGDFGIGLRGTGEVTLRNQGAIHVTGQTVLGAEAGSEGRMTVTGGAQFTTSHIEMGLAEGTASGFLTIGVDDATGRVETGGLDLRSGELRLGDGGVLDLSGGTAAIGANATVTGTGLIDGHLALSGHIAPGHSIGTINVSDITFNTGAVYEVEVTADGAADRITASGTATINGGSVQVLAGAGNYAPATTYTILTSLGGRSGTFTEGVTSNLAFLDPSLSYDALNVYLTMTRNDINFGSAGLTPNQMAAGRGIESLGLGHAAYDGVLNLSAEQARNAFDQVSGESHLSVRTMMQEDSRFVRHGLTERLRMVAATDGPAVWGQLIGAQGHWGSDGNAARLNRSLGGFLLGADAVAFDNWHFGAAGGYSRSQFKTKAIRTSGEVDSYHLGLYGGTRWNDFTFRTGAAYSWHDLTSSRHVAYASFVDTPGSNYKAKTTQIFGEVGYELQTGPVSLEPFANLAHVRLRTDGFSEKGSAASLTIHVQEMETTFSTVGLRASTRFELGQTRVSWSGAMGWRHAYSDKIPHAYMRFVDGGDAFAISGVAVARNAASIETGFDVQLSPGTKVRLAYDGQYGTGSSDQSLRITLKAKF